MIIDSTKQLDISEYKYITKLYNFKHLPKDIMDIIFKLTFGSTIQQSYFPCLMNLVNCNTWYTDDINHKSCVRNFVFKIKEYIY